MPETERKKTKYRFGSTEIYFLVIISLATDALTLIPFVGDFVGPIFWIIFSFYLFFKGMGIVNGRRLAVEAISTIAEVIPGIQELPTILAGVAIIIAITRFEDKTGIEVIGKKGKLNIDVLKENKQKILKKREGERRFTNTSPRQIGQVDAEGNSLEGKPESPVHTKLDSTRLNNIGNPRRNGTPVNHVNQVEDNEDLKMAA